MPVKVNPLTMSQAHSRDYLQGWNDCHKMMAEEIIRQDTRIENLEAAIPEGCTPEDARVLRGANHDLAARVDELGSALQIAWDAMRERRGYAEAWEWKYGKTWDEEDATVQAALNETNASADAR